MIMVKSHVSQLLTSYEFFLLSSTQIYVIVTDKWKDGSRNNGYTGGLIDRCIDGLFD